MTRRARGHAIVVCINALNGCITKHCMLQSWPIGWTWCSCNAALQHLGCANKLSAQQKPSSAPMYYLCGAYTLGGGLAARVESGRGRNPLYGSKYDASVLSKKRRVIFGLPGYFTSTISVWLGIHHQIGAVCLGIIAVWCCLTRYRLISIPNQTETHSSDTQANRNTQLRYPVKQHCPLQIPSQTALYPVFLQGIWIIRFHLTACYCDTQSNQTEIPRQTEPNNPDTQSNRKLSI